MWSWLTEIFAGQTALLIALGGCVALLVVGAGIACLFRETGLFTAVATALTGGLTLFIAFWEPDARASLAGLSLFLVLVGVSHAVLFSVIWARQRITERKRSRGEIARRLCYTLPDRENSYIRTRLNTTLRVEENDVNADMGGSEELKRSIKLAYARQLLSKVKEAELTRAERLQVEETERAFSLYLTKERWNTEDLRAVNDLCASLLKLSAKYAV